MKLVVKKRILANMSMDVAVFRKTLSETLDISKAVFASVKILSKEDNKLPDDAVLRALIDRQNWGVFLKDLQSFNKASATITFVSCGVSDFVTYSPLYEVKSGSLFVFSEDIKGDELQWSEELFLIDDVCKDLNDFFKSFFAKIGYSTADGFVDSEAEAKNNGFENESSSQEGSEKDNGVDGDGPLPPFERSSDVPGVRRKGLGKPGK